MDLNAAETSPRTIGLDKGQLAWLDQDLTAAAANREQVPWIVVTVSSQLPARPSQPCRQPSLSGRCPQSHFPIYLSATVDEFADASAAYYLSTEAEAVPPGSVSAATVGSSSDCCRDLTTVAASRTRSSSRARPTVSRRPARPWGI